MRELLEIFRRHLVRLAGMSLLDWRILLGGSVALVLVVVTAYLLPVIEVGALLLAVRLRLAVCQLMACVFGV